MAGLAASAEERAAIKISADNEIAVFSGWGTGLYCWGETLGSSEKLSTEAAQLLYGENGLGMDIVRYDLGGGDDPRHDHYLNDNAVAEGWWSPNGLDTENMLYSLDISLDGRQLNTLRKVNSVTEGSAVIEMCSFSPPYFMTNSGCTAGAVYSGEDNIREDCYDDYAGYIASAAAKLKETGINVSSVAPMYEPSSLHWRAFDSAREGCHVSQGDPQSKLITQLRQSLDNKGLSSVTISAADETDMTTAATGMNALTPQAKSYTDRLTVHYISGSADDLRAAAERRPVWVTEVDGLYTAGENAGEMSAGLGLGKRIIADINNAGASAWLMWQAVISGTPDLENSYLGLVHLDNKTAELKLSQRYYTFGQFSRYIRPSSTVIAVDENTIAAYDSSKGELAIVAVNDTAAAKPVKFSLDGFDLLKTSAVTEVRTSGSLAEGEHWAEKENAATLYRTGFSADLAPNSVTTYVLSDVMLHVEGTLGDINCDGDINITDLNLVAAHVKAIRALDAEELILADVNGDGDVNVTDVSLVAAHVKGLRALESVRRYTEDDILTDEETTADEDTTGPE